MLGALREGEQPDVARLPGREKFHGRVEQALSDGPIPVLGPAGQRTEEPDAAPVGGEVRPDQAAIELCGQRGPRIRSPPGADIIGVAEKSFRVRSSEEGAERYPKDPVTLIQVPVAEGTDVHLSGIAHVCSLNSDDRQPPAVLYNRPRQVSRQAPGFDMAALVYSVPVPARLTR